MALESRLELRLTQKLILTPQLQQAIKLLQMPHLELSQFLNQELMENPFLEESADEVSIDELSREEKDSLEIEETQEDEGIPLEKRMNFSIDEYFEDRVSDGRDMGYFNPGTVTPPSFEQFLSKKPDLYDHLLCQLRMLHVSESVKRVGEIIIGNIDENGYLAASLEEICSAGMVHDKKLREAIRLGIKTLIIQEVRLLRLERAFPPTIVMDEMALSIQETKKTIIQLIRAIKDNERTALLKRMIHQAVDEEIDRAIELRKTRCIRCLHGRFYDEAGIAHVNLPVRTQVKTIGCDKLRPNLKRSCKRFVEMSIADSMDHYLNEMTLLYEFRELIDRIEEIWKDYLVK